MCASFRTLGQPDPNAPQTIANARAAGIFNVDVYMFPCPNCIKSAGEQVKEMVNSLGGFYYERIWLDIEVCVCVCVCAHTQVQVARLRLACSCF